jgi:hypothetical protein
LQGLGLDNASYHHLLPLLLLLLLGLTGFL